MTDGERDPIEVEMLARALGRSKERLMTQKKIWDTPVGRDMPPDADLDDPPLGPTGEFPRGKFNEDDKGSLNLRMGIMDKTIIIDFRTKLAWIGFGADEAEGFANNILELVRVLKNPGRAREGK